jgi:hypothetical protein
VIGGLCVLAFFGGSVAGVYSAGEAVFLAFAVWIIGATAANVLIDQFAARGTVRLVRCLPHVTVT